MKTINLLFAILFLGTTSIMAQISGNSLHFDGTNDHVTTPLPTVFNDIPNNDFTIEMWIKPENNSFSSPISAQFDANNLVVISLTSNRIYFGVKVNGTTLSRTTNGNLPLNSWSHVACSWNATSNLIEIYINGVMATTNSSSSASTGTSNMMSIGAKTNATQLFEGELDEVRIWDDLRTPCETVNAMYSEFTTIPANLVTYYNFNQTTGTTLPDLTTNNLDGTLSPSSNANWVSSGAGIIATNLATPFPVTTCDTYTWVNGNANTYTSSTSVNHTFTSAQGCDSIVSLDLTINNSASSTDTKTACNSFTWINNTTYTQNNQTATHTIPGGAANGCDSTVMLDLTIKTVNTAITQAGAFLSADEAGATYQWFDCSNQALIPGATNQTFTATANGDYAVAITANGCTENSTCYTVTGVGIIENDFGKKLLLYPNPTKGDFVIDLGNNYPTTNITLTDLSGKLLQASTHNNSQLLHLKLKEPAGVYLLHIQSEDKKATIRLIKE